MKTRVLSLIAVSTLMAVGAASAAAQDEFTHELKVRDITEQLVISFHAEAEKMVPCTPEQRDWIGQRGIERLTTMSKALVARSVGRGDPDGKVLKVELDAACYEGGFMGLAGLGRGDEKILFPYEESVLEGEWGPSTDKPVQ
jgi:hypothetical protein